MSSGAGPTTPVLPPPRRDRSRGASRAGFTLVEVMIGMTMIALALLSYASTSMSHFRLSREETRRTTVIQITREFIERLRADDDWTGLYATLRQREDEAGESVAGAARLENGSWARPLTDFYADMDVPPSLDDMTVYVDVPASIPAGAPPEATERVLREDADLSLFGLPADLNGDGAVDADARDDDYVALPVAITFRWTSDEGSPRELRRLTWLRGNR